MAILTFMNVPREKYEEIERYRREINMFVELEGRSWDRLFGKIERRELYDESGALLDVEELGVEIRAPVKKEYRDRANEAIRNLRRFIIGDKKTDG